MRRREFTMLLASAGLGWPLRASAQRAHKLPTIGFLGPSTAAIASERTAAFEQRLHELGWLNCRSVLIEYRWADGRAERFGEIADEFVLDNVDVIVTWGTATAIAAKRAIENSGGVLEMQEAEAAARKLGIEPKLVPIRRGEDISAAMETLKGQADALDVAGDALFNANRVRVNTLALAARLPSVHGHREIVEAGGLMSYGPDYLDLFRRTADFVDKVLRGTRPEDIPVEQPTKFEFAVNLTTAKALGLTIPATLLARADEVIE